MLSWNFPQIVTARNFHSVCRTNQSTWNRSSFRWRIAGLFAKIFRLDYAQVVSDSSYVFFNDFAEESFEPDARNSLEDGVKREIRSCFWHSGCMFFQSHWRRIKREKMDTYLLSRSALARFAHRGALGSCPSSPSSMCQVTFYLKSDNPIHRDPLMLMENAFCASKLSLILATAEPGSTRHCRAPPSSRSTIEQRGILALLKLPTILSKERIFR